MSEPQDLDFLLEELELGSARGGKRRPAEEVEVTVVRPLVPDDIELLLSPPPVGSAPSIPEIRHQHHQIAGLIARGIPNVEISGITGYSPSFISTLRNAPDMQELVAYYAGMAEERTVDALARLRGLGISSVEELQTRLNEDPKQFTVAQLTDLVEVGILKPEALKGGGKPQGTSGVMINLNFKAPESSSPVLDLLPAKEAAE